MGLDVRKTITKAKKIDKSALETFKIVIAGFLLWDKVKKVLFFQKTFSLTNTSIEIVIEIVFFTLVLQIYD